MQEHTHDHSVALTAFVVGMLIFALLSWGPVARRVNVLEPKDPAQAMKIFFFIIIGLWVFVGLAMSIGLLFKGLLGG